MFSVVNVSASVSTSGARKSSGSGPLPSPHVRDPREDLPNQVQLAGLASNEIGRRGTLPKNYSVTILERLHTLRQKLPEQCSTRCPSSLSRSIYFVIHWIEHLIPLVGTRTLKWFPKFCHQYWFLYMVLRVYEVGTQPVVQEWKLVLNIWARYPVYYTIEL